MSAEGIFGTKAGMTQIFEENGDSVPVTVIETPANVVVQVKTSTTDGYDAIQIGLGERKRVNSPQKGHMGDLGKFKYLRELKVDDIGKWEVGQKLAPSEVFAVGDLVDVTGTTKGRGFTGVVKRHGFRGGPKTHGQSDRLRAPGSIGAGTSPGRVIKGKKMAGHMGTTSATVKSLRVVRVDDARGVVMLRGAVPGNTGKLVKIRKSPRGKAGR